MLTTLHLLDDLRLLLGRLGWLQFVTLQEAMYERLIWESMSFIVVDLKRVFQGDFGYIRFRLFNQTFEINLTRFNELFHLPNHGVLTPVHDDYN